MKVGRNTVTAAYQELIDEGYLEARHRQGVFVAGDCLPLQVERLAEDPGPQAHSSMPDWSERIVRSQRPAVDPVEAEERWQDYPYRFVYGTYDPELFPTEGFRECCLRSLSRVQMPQWAPDFETVDVPELVEQIRQRLLPRRGVFAGADEILITVGSQHAFYLLAEALLASTRDLVSRNPGIRMHATVFPCVHR